MMVGQLFGWSGMAFHVLCVIALVVAVAIYAKRIGGLGPWLVGVVAVLDLFVTMAYGLVTMTMRGGAVSYKTIESTYDALGVVDLMLTLLSAALVVAGFAMMRKPS